MQDQTRPGPAALETRQLRREAAALREQGRFAEAAEALGRAVAGAPDDADAHAELGLTFSMMGRPAQAEACYRRAIELNPRDVFALANLAGTLQQLNRRAEAEPLFRRVLELEPGHVPALRNLGVLLKDAARPMEAKAVFLEASRRDPGLEPAIQAHLALTPMTRSVEDIAEQRAGYARGLEAFAADPRAFAYGGEKANLPWYYLAYHGQDDRELLERTAEVLAAKVPGLDAVSPHLAGWCDPKAEGRRIRVAFCSEFFHAHTIGRLNRGFIRHLDRSRFELVLLHGPHTVRDATRAEHDGLADRSVTLAQSPEAQRRQVAEIAPDVLFYPDIGMSALTWFLAQARLAPVQAVSWGHPNTTGLKSLDYFVSCDAIEPPRAEERYTERLVRLGRLPCAYDIPPPPPAASREALGLPLQGVLYGCPQTLFKFHPDFDAVLAGIAEGDPTGHIMLIEAKISAWTEVLKARWAAAWPILLERVRFLPRLTHQGFMAHLAHIDVLLDPLHFGSGNTLYEGIALGTPIVTCPGEFARGRIVAAAYDQMGIADPPVVAGPEAYVETALALGRDPARRARLRAELQARARTGLYDDLAAVREFEAFLEAAVSAAGRGERLPAGWRPQMAESAP